MKEYLSNFRIPIIVSQFNLLPVQVGHATRAGAKPRGEERKVQEVYRQEET